MPLSLLIAVFLLIDFVAPENGQSSERTNGSSNSNTKSPNMHNAWGAVRWSKGMYRIHPFPRHHRHPHARVANLPDLMYGVHHQYGYSPYGQYQQHIQVPEEYLDHTRLSRGGIMSGMYGWPSSGGSVNSRSSVYDESMDGTAQRSPHPHTVCSSCADGQFLCDWKCECIAHALRCDGANDCHYGEDERDCAVDGVCRALGYIKCPSSNICIREMSMCDGIPDCEDASDEANCTTAMNCTSKEFVCNNGYCVPQTWKCDGDNDCKDNSDELNCTVAPCSDAEFACGDMTCISSDWRCNQAQDCADNSDETDCDVPTEIVQCASDEFACKYPVCIPEDYRCDGDNDCGDWSDEENCQSCVPGDFLCKSGSCLSSRQRCDGEKDCDDGEDEADCAPQNSVTCSPEQYSCDSGDCINKTWVCDGMEDCLSGEDEHSCPCDPKTHLLCSSELNTTSTASPVPVPAPGQSTASKTVHNSFYSPLTCIPRNKICDGKIECPNGDDEKDCPTKHECPPDSPCQSLCLLTSDRKEVCGCNEGFRLNKDGVTCDDVDECTELVEPPCPQLCRNTQGSYNCSCYLGYVLRTDKRTCKSVETAATLLITNRVDIRQVNLNNLRSRTLLKGLHNAVALDFHWERGEVYWSDYSMKVINKAFINGTAEQDVIRWGLQNPAGLAVDWVHDLIFWTDSELRRVDAAHLNGSMPTTIAQTDLDKPRDIVVHPGHACVFWTDWGPNPKIERINMDGSERSAVVRTGIHWPNGLAIDYGMDRIFWADARHHVIESADLDGRKRSVVVSKGLPHPFALTLFEHTVYWTDWHTKSVMGANKLTGEQRHVILDRLHFPMQIHSCHGKRQRPYQNHCPAAKKPCSHLCLPSRTGFRCICPVGIRLRSDGRTCSQAPDNLLIYVRKKEIRLRDFVPRPQKEVRQDGEFSVPQDVVLQVDGVRAAQAIAWDDVEDSIYWSDIKAETITRARRDGSDQRIVVGSDLHQPIGLAIDWVRRRLYFSDYVNKRIETTDLEGRQRVVLLYGLQGPRQIALNPEAGMMYWSDWGGQPHIASAGMDGSSKTMFVRDAVVAPGAITIDPLQRKMYWTDSGIRSIESISLDGTGRKVIKANLAHPLGLDIYGSVLYWTDSKTNDLSMYDIRDNKNQTLRSSVSGLLGVSVLHHNRRNVSSRCTEDNGGCSHVCLLAPNDGRAACACPVGHRMREGGTTCEPQPGPYLLLARRVDIRRVPLTMPFAMDIVVPLPPLRNTVAVDADRATGDLYWSDTVDDVIMRSSGDGGNVTIIVSAGLDTPYGLAVDSVGRKLYWTDSGRRVIEVSELDGSKRLVLIWTDLRNPCALTLHYTEGLMFWSDWEEPNGRIERSGMDGSARKAILKDDLGWPGALVVYAGRLYWTDVRLQVIESAKLDGSNRSIVMDRLREQPVGVAIISGKMFWAYRTASTLHSVSIPKSPINASDDTVFRTNVPGLLDIKAIEPQSLPSDECAEHLCSDLCLRSPVGYSCACPTGISMSPDGRTCSSTPPDELLFATDTGLARISVDPLRNFHDVPIYMGEGVKIVALDYHWEKRLVVYTDLTNGLIRTVSMHDWSRSTTIVSSNLSEPNHIALDWLADNVFWTDSVRRVVEVARLDGSARKTLVNSEIHSPRAIVVHPKKGWMFWTDWGEKYWDSKHWDAKIERANMDGTARMVIVGKDLGTPNGLTLDSTGAGERGRLYWADSSRNIIESSRLNGQNRLQLLNDRASPFGITLLGDHIYWTDFVKRTVERADKNNGRNRQSAETANDFMSDLKAVSESRQRRSGQHVCQNNGGCSHLCLARETDYICACPDSPDGRECKATVHSRPTPSADDEDYLEPVELPQTPTPTQHVGNATSKVGPVTSVLLILIPAGLLILAVIAIVSFLWIRGGPLTGGFGGSLAGTGAEKVRGKGSVLTYSNPNYMSEGSGGSAGGRGYRGWIRRLKYDPSAERVFDVNDEGGHGGPEILSLINSHGSIIAENSSSVMEGISPPLTPPPPPPPRSARPRNMPA